MLLSQINNDYHSNPLLGFYRHTIWGITVWRMWMSLASKDVLLNLHYYYFNYYYYYYYYSISTLLLETENVEYFCIYLSRLFRLQRASIM